MKTISKLFLLGATVLSLSACMKYDFNVDYQAPVKISFAGVDANNICTLAKGVDNYSAQINVSSSKGLSYFELYTADAQTGAAQALIEGSQKVFTDGEKSYSYTYDFTGLTDNAAIRVSVTDAEGTTISRNLVVAVTAAVEFSETVTVETAEVYYGIYYASWLSGRAYMRTTANIEQYKSHIDVAFGEVEGVATIMSPAARSTFALPNLAGLATVKIAETTMSESDYNAITKVNAAPITAIAEPTLESAAVKAGSVYVFSSTDGRKGLILVKSVASKSATIENVAGEWVENTQYHQLSISSKVVAE